MRVSSKARAALIGLMAVFAIAATPAQAAKVYFGTQEYLRNIQDVEAKGPKEEALYLGHKYSFHSFILPYSLSDDGYILGNRGGQSYFWLDDANPKSLQARGLLPSPLLLRISWTPIAAARTPTASSTTPCGRWPARPRPPTLPMLSPSHAGPEFWDVIHALPVPWQQPAHQP